MQRHNREDARMRRIIFFFFATCRQAQKTFVVAHFRVLMRRNRQINNNMMYRTAAYQYRQFILRWIRLIPSYRIDDNLLVLLLNQSDYSR